MSQSDYIRYKKTGVQLNSLSKFRSVITPQQYVAFKGYTLANTITNTKTVYRQLIPPGRQRVFGIDKVVTNCPQFILCRGTQARANRKRLLSTQIAHRPPRKYIKHPVNYKYQYTMRCKCKNVKCKCTPVCQTCFTTPIVAPKCAAFAF